MKSAPKAVIEPKAKPKAKAVPKAKAKPAPSLAISTLVRRYYQAFAQANEYEHRFYQVFCQGQNEHGQWTLCKCPDQTAQEFIFNYLQQDLGMSPRSAAGFVGDLYLATIGGKKIRSNQKISEVVEHMGHIQVCRRGRGGMEQVPVQVQGVQMWYSLQAIGLAVVFADDGRWRTSTHAGDI